VHKAADETDGSTTDQQQENEDIERSHLPALAEANFPFQPCSSRESVGRRQPGPEVQREDG
jgi:hypothetical protein